MKRIACDKCRPDCQVGWRIDLASKDESREPVLQWRFITADIRLGIEIVHMQISKLLDNIVSAKLWGSMD